jgi:cadmium resistance protein CadD (predicted permease)
MEILIIVIVAVSAFVATNLDDIFVLIAYFAHNDFNNVSVILGQYMGVTLLILISSLAYLFKFIIPPTYIALFGILPIIIGLKGLWSLKQDAPKDLLNESFTQNSLGNNELLNSEVSIYKIFKVASITFSNGGDNIGVYAPLFASMSIFPLIFTLIIFMLMIGLWCFIGYLMVRNRIVGNKLKRYGHIILPFVLILIGFGVLLGGGSIFSLNY